MAATAEPVAVEPAAPAGGKAARWSGPIGIENQRTGDGRLIERDALRWDSLPIPLRWAMQDFGAHDGAYVVGKIESIDRLSYDETNERLAASGRDPLPESFADAVVIWGEGSADLGSEHGREAYRQVQEGLTPGISMDLDDIVIREEGEDSFTITEGRVRAATQVAIPAFEGAKIAVSDAGKEVFDADGRLGDLDALMGDDEAFNWVEDAGGLPEYIKRIKKHLEEKGMDESRAISTAVNVVKRMCATGDLNFPGAQQVNAGSRAEACAAVQDWEAKKASTHAADDALTASAAGWRPPREWFEDPRLQGPTGLTVTDDGRVYGHIALWGTCHIASPEGPHVCTQPPRSPSKYANFHLGSTVTDDGATLPTGKITMNTLHAGQRLSMVDTLHHYEHTGTVGAHVRASEDQFGIWLAGAAVPGADLVALRAAPVSGDWRSPSGSLDMVAALSVNVPGFPVPRAQALVAGGAVVSLVASGMVQREERTEAMAVTLDVMDDATVLALRDRFREMDRRDKAAALAARVRRSAALMRVERVRRVALAYNKDQWRVPKGNPEGGRWIDMPDAAVKDLEGAIQGALENSSLNAGEADALGKRLDTAVKASEAAAASLKSGDGPEATVHAKEAQAALSQVEGQLQDHVDNGEIPESEAANIGDKLDAARAGVDSVANSDLSLLGQDDIGGPGGVDSTPAADAGKGPADVGGGDAKAPSASDVGAADDATQKAQDAADSLESTMYSLFDSTPINGDAEAISGDLGDSLAAAVDAAHQGDPAASNKALDDLERKLQGYVDGGQVDMADADAAAVGDRIEALRKANEGLDPQGSAAEPPDAEKRAKDLLDALDKKKAGKPFDIPASKIKGGMLVDTPDGVARVTGDPVANPDGSVTVHTDKGQVDLPKDGTLPSVPADKVPAEYGGPDAGDAAEPADAAKRAKDLMDALDKRAAKAPDGVPQAEWDSLTPEQRSRAASAIARGSRPADAIKAAKGGAPKTPPGSAQQQNAKKVDDTASRLEQVLQDGFNGSSIPEEDAAAVGDRLDDFRSKVDALTGGVQGGSYSAQDLQAAQQSLSALEESLMQAANGSGISDADANQMGQALDDMFADLGTLAQSLRGDTTPPPFATRRYSRVWLGRKGFSLAAFPRQTAGR